MTDVAELPATRAGEERRRRRSWPLAVGYTLPVVVGAVLLVLAAYAQPFNQNELLQMGPYGSGDVDEITGATRQPPLDPLLGALVQQWLGVGQLEQRLVPVLSGVATLVLVAALLWRRGAGWAGPAALLLLATSPLMVRYAAYSRPYALPLLLMMLFAYGADRWIVDRRPGWLVTALVAAGLMPLARVPEPTVFLATAFVVLGLLALRRRVDRRRTAPILVGLVLALVLVARPMAQKLAEDAPSFVAPGTEGLVERIDAGAAEVWEDVLPMLGQWLPWWPLTVLLLVLPLLLAGGRRRLASWWFAWPLLAGPVAGLLAYHFASGINFESIPYKSRSAYFFVPALALFAAATLRGLLDRGRALAPAGVALLAAAVATQLPHTVRVLTVDEAPDYDAAGRLVTAEVPPDAVVLHDQPGLPDSGWRQPFLAEERYVGGAPDIVHVPSVARRPALFEALGPFHLLVNGACVLRRTCPDLAEVWPPSVDGYSRPVVESQFAVYAPDRPLRGRLGAARGLEALGESLGPETGYVETFAAARLYKDLDMREEGIAAIERMYARADEQLETEIRAVSVTGRLNPFPQAFSAGGPE